MDKKPNKALTILGFIIVVLVLTGSYFKMMHWPGAAMFLVFTPVIFLFLYLPIWLSEARHEKGEKLFVWVQFLFTAFFLITHTFKTFHWPFGGLLVNILFWSTWLFLIPFTIYKLFVRSRTSLFQFNNLVLMIYLISGMQLNMMRASETNVGAGAILLSSKQAEKSRDIIVSKSKHLYMAFEKLQDKEQNPFYKKAQQLKDYADSTANYVHDLKTRVMMEVEEISKEQADTLSISLIHRRTEVSVPTSLLVGSNEENPVKGKYTGTELKLVVERYRDSVIKFADNENRAFIASGVNLNTEDVMDPESNEYKNWVTYNFYGLPSISVLITLTNLETEVRNAETQVLTNLLNNASNASGTNLGSQIAELSFKLESEKQNREIENLQKDKELGQLKLNAKNQQIAERDSAIFIFSLVIMVFLIMIFYIIRSNIARKKINKQLEEQKKDIEQKKELIEEKQKEILDSIHYAKRIQMSQLANEKYIERVFNRLMGR